MVTQERQPIRWFVRLILRLAHVVADRVVTRRIVAEKPQGVPDSFGTPYRILSPQPANQIPHLLWHWRPARLSPRLPAPVETEGCGVPALDRGGLHQMYHLMPFIPGLGQQHPKQSESLGESGPRSILPLDPTLARGQLTFCRQDSCRQSCP